MKKKNFLIESTREGPGYPKKAIVIGKIGYISLNWNVILMKDYILANTVKLN